MDRLAINTATALTAIHRTGIVHRDFKPDNVVMGPGGPRVIDFGISRWAHEGLTTDPERRFGTYAYAAPELLNMQPMTTGSDMFSWAGTMLFAATGQDPFGNDMIEAVAARIRNDQPDLSALAGQLAIAVRGCLHKDPGQRYTAEQVLLELLGGQTRHPAEDRLELTRKALNGVREQHEKAVAQAEMFRSQFEGADSLYRAAEAEVSRLSDRVSALEQLQTSLADKLGRSLEREQELSTKLQRNAEALLDSRKQVSQLQTRVQQQEGLLQSYSKVDDLLEEGGRVWTREEQQEAQRLMDLIEADLGKATRLEAAGAETTSLEKEIFSDAAGMFIDATADMNRRLARLEREVRGSEPGSTA